MALEYTVKRNQNVFDVAVQLYGSIEGLFDLLMTNEISISDNLKEGQVLEYHKEFIRNQDVLDTINEDGTIIAHGNGNIVGTPSFDNTVYVIKMAVDNSPVKGVFGSINISGTGDAYVDWGDGKFDHIKISSIPSNVGHNYAYPGTYKISIYNCSGIVYDVLCDGEIYRKNNNGYFIIGQSLIGGEDLI